VTAITILLWLQQYCILLLCLDARITGHIFLSLNESQLRRFGLSFGFRFVIMEILEDMVS
jgi:hypothetical protein